MSDPATDASGAAGKGKIIPPAGQTEATRVAPDVAEQLQAGSGLDPGELTGFHDQPIVGLGGSAGGISALQAFFRQTPPDTGFAFVVVLHLSPEHESTLAELLQRTTAMPVTQVRDRLQVKPNQVYVIPPGKHLTMLDGHVGLSDLERERGRRVAVDLFFRTLADTHGPNAVAVVLSGADSDGAIGIKRIKERGGLTIAQDPQECDHVEMPRSAIETGMIDWVLRAGEMPARIREFRQAGARLQLPAAADVETLVANAPSDNAGALRDVLAVIRARTGRDFSAYKTGTILRRIARRMQVNGLSDLAAYHAFLRSNPGETAALQQDLLISVTNFFRDRDAFASLEAAVPSFFQNKGASDVVRVWVSGCATGEEAYSIAILLTEHASKLPAPPRIQIFATDIDETAISLARAAQYPETIVADVSEERLRRFFVRQQDKFRVNQALREVVLFAIHDVLRDAPFSQLDLVSCRNLLIYLSRESQKRCFELFHFALRAGGHLFLGTSETAEDASELFAALHKKHRLYTRRAAHRSGLPIPAGPLTLTLALQAQRGIPKVVLPANGGVPDAIGASLQTIEQRAISASDLHFKLIEAFAPPSAVVHRDSQIVHLSANAGRFLQFTGGEPTTNLLHLVHPMLRVELRAALFRAAEAQDSVNIPAVPVELEPGETRLVDISVRSAHHIGADLFLVVFNERQAVEGGVEPAHRPAGAEGIVRSLERELELLKQQLRASVEQHSAATEEMKASNEELQAMNEELRSAAEELETSREELQSINEELATVNLELKGKVDELSRVNGDLQNLMAATNIATIFVDRELCIQRYTPS